MTKRKPVLVLFIIAALFLIAGVVLFALPTMITPVADIQVSFPELNQGILTALTGTRMVTNILTIAITVIVFIIIPLIVHIRRKQTSVTVVLLIGALVALYVDLLLISFTELKAGVIEQTTKDQAALQDLLSKAGLLLAGFGLISLASVLELVIFIVDMCIRVKKEPVAVPTAQEMREEPVEEELEEEPEEEPVPVAAAPVAEPEEEEELEEEPEEPEEEEPEEETPVSEEKVEAPVEEEKVEEPAEEKKPAKKTASKKPAAKKAEPKKAPAKKAEKKPAAKKEEPKKAARETTTIKKPSETQTIKKAEVLTNDEGKQFVKAYHVSQRKELNKWQVKGAGSEKALKLFDTQKEAIEYANQLSANNGAAVRVHSRAGKMRKA